MFRFAAPLWFLCLLALPALAWWWRRRRPPALRLSSLAGLEGLPRSFWVRTRWLVRVLQVLSLVLLVAGLARPQWGNREVVRMQEGINIVLALDLSESMAAIDFELEGQQVTRLDAVKAVVEDFIEGRSGDRIGLVVFGTEAYTQLPLTTDYDTLVATLQRLEIGAAGPSTALGDALGVATRRLEDVESRSNVVVLLTDGQSNAGELSPEAAAGAARQLGVKAYTIGIGSDGEAPFVVEDPLWGRRVVYRRVAMDEDTLRSIADTTGGMYFRAAGLEGLREVYQAIDRLEKTEVETRTYEQYDELYAYAVLPALALLLAAMLAAATRWYTTRLPHRGSSTTNGASPLEPMPMV